MKIFLVRHGIAEDVAPSGRDEDRRLTEQGRTKVGQIAQALKTLNVRPNRILTSPYPRAAETAEIIAKTVGAFDNLSPYEYLCYGQGIEQRVHSLLDPDESCLMLVGHEPDMSNLVWKLAGRGTNVRFKKGGVARIDMAHPEAIGELVWFLAPKVLVALGK